MRLFILLVLAALITLPAAAQGDQARIFPYDYHVRDFDNGLRAIVIPTDFPNIVSLQIPVSTGSRNEVEPGKSGFAHFFEHMMFRGTEQYPTAAYQAMLKNMGADQNAYTSDDLTVYHMTFSNEDLETALMLEADRFQNLSYSEADFRTEALAVLGEYNKNAANPIRKIFEVQREAAFQDHTYRHTTMGFIEDIEDMPNQYAYSREFFRRYYRPENTTIIVTGDVESDATFDLIERYWAAWEPGYEPVDIPAEPAPQGPIYAHVNWEAETLPWVTVGFYGPSAYPTADNAAAGDMQALDVLAQVAFSSSSPLYQRLVVEEQKVDQLFSYFPDRRDPYLLTVMARVPDPADIPHVREAIQMTMADLRVATPDPTRIADIKSALKYGFAAGMNSSANIAGAVVTAVAATRDIETLNAIYAQYDAITPADVQRVANTYFTDDRMVVVTLAQGDLEGEGAAMGSVDDIVATIGPSLAAASERVEAPRRTTPTSAPMPAFEELVMDSSSPLVNLRFLFEVGAADDPAGKEGLSQLTALMVADAGSQALTYADLQQALYPMAAGFGAQVDKEMTVFAGTVHRDNLNRYYDVVGSQLLEPGFREEDFSRVKTNLLNQIRVGLRANNDEELGKEVLYEMLYAGHPYGHLTLGHAEAVEALTLDDVREFYEMHYIQPLLTVAVAGDAPDDFLERMRADLAANLPAEGTDVSERTVAQIPMPDGMRVTLVDKDTRATAISMGFPIDIRRGDPDFVALYLIRSYFGEHRSSNSYLYQRIREIRGMNYGDYAYIEYFPSGMFQFHPDPNLGRQQQIFQMWIRPVPPEQAHFALRIAKYELDRLVRDGLSEEDFEATRNYLIKFTSVLTASQGRALGYALDSDYYGTEEFVDYIRDGLADLTLAGVNRVLRATLDTDGMAVAIITPNAEDLAEKLIADTPSPISYASEKADEIYEEDRVVQQYPLGLDADDVRIIDVDDVFERPVFE
ncbi:MAG: insulinase family protein [Rhodothermaceae bacterium]|nr:insulinase family protein [Rhodothermaceae bacterium]